MTKENFHLMLASYDFFYKNKSYNIDIPAFIINKSISDDTVKEMNKIFKSDFVQRTNNLEEICNEISKRIFMEKHKKEKETRALEIKSKRKNCIKTCLVFFLFFLLLAVPIVPGISKYCFVKKTKKFCGFRPKTN